MDRQDKQLPNDYLETVSASNPSTPDAPDESRSTESDAGLNEVAPFDAAGRGENREDAGGPREIPMSDLENAPREDVVHTPELSDLNTPGEVDIEDLDEDAAKDALPADARLEPLEE